MKLPTLNPAALEHSAKLTQFISHDIVTSGGYISFARFMELALYAPGLGYYSAGSHKLGKGGDFVTAPEISPLFAQCIANQCQPILNELKTGDILEIGAGSGIFAKDILLQLEKLDSLPQNYYILEISPDLRERQKNLLQLGCPHLFSRIVWLDSLPSAFCGIIFANEVMDAMPVHCFRIDKDGAKERCVRWEKDQFVWHIAPATTPVLSKQLNALQHDYCLEIGYESEINTQLPAWIASLADSLKQGILLLIDYGYGRSEYYHPDREQGTLMCFYQHHRHDNPFLYVGLQDITAHVDFTSVVESAVDTGLMLAGYTTQASFLLACGLLELADQNSPSEIERYTQNQAIKKLTLPSQMGELVKVIALAKGYDLPLVGFTLHDRRRDL